MASVTTMAATVPLRAKGRPQVLRIMEAMRLEAGEQMIAAFPGCLKIYALPLLPASTLSKARLAYFCGPYFRAALVLLALRVGGADKARALRLVAWLAAWVERLWPDADTPEVKDVAEKFVEVDAAEDVARVRFLCAPNPDTASAWRRTLEQQVALAPVAIEALVKEGGQG